MLKILGGFAGVGVASEQGAEMPASKWGGKIKRKVTITDVSAPAFDSSKFDETSSTVL